MNTSNAKADMTWTPKKRLLLYEIFINQHIPCSTGVCHVASGSTVWLLGSTVLLPGSTVFTPGSAVLAPCPRRADAVFYHVHAGVMVIVDRQDHRLSDFIPVEVKSTMGVCLPGATGMYRVATVFYVTGAQIAQRRQKVRYDIKEYVLLDVNKFVICQKVRHDVTLPWPVLWIF